MFGIGLSRTGTTSLCFALEVLGYKCVHCPRDIVEIAGLDAAADITVSMRFKTLDLLFPGSKFIYTIRDIPEWLDSCDRHFNGADRAGRPAFEYEQGQEIFACYWEAERVMYGQLEFDRDAWEAAYKRHDRNVREYFADRKQDLLVIDITKTDNWKDIMSFLEVDSIPFPHRNRGQ